MTKELIPVDAFNWLEYATEEYFPFVVELNPALRGWAKFATLMCEKKWRIRAKNTLCFEMREDAELMFEKWGDTFAYFKPDGSKIIEDKVVHYKHARAEIIPGLKNKDAVSGTKVFDERDKMKVWERQSIAYQMFSVSYSLEEIADELNYSTKASVQQVINYVRKQKFHENIDYARLYRDENLSYLEEAKLALVDHMRKTGYEKNKDLMSVLLQIIKEENMIAGAYSPEKMQIISNTSIEHMSNQELLKFMNQIISENDIIDAEPVDRDK